MQLANGQMSMISVPVERYFLVLTKFASAMLGAFYQTVGYFLEKTVNYYHVIQPPQNIKNRSTAI